MSAEFVDTNILIYAHDLTAGAKRTSCKNLLTRLLEEFTGAISTQVMAEFYSTYAGKLRMKAEEAEEILADLGTWTIHRPNHEDLLRASRLHRNHGISWWDALIVNSAMQVGCNVLWSEDLAHGRKFGQLTVRNPFQ